MRKTTMQTIANYIANVPELREQYDEIMAELNRDASKLADKRAIYDEVKDIILNALAMQTQAITASELYDEVKDSLPETFTKGKLQYALTNDLYPEVRKIRPANTRGVYTYMRA